MKIRRNEMCPCGSGKKYRLSSMWSIISNAEICPIVYEILEELKEVYNFNSHK